ncbi:MAG: MFS transporter [Nakamurella sp.]
MRAPGALSYPAFVRFWIADAVSNLGSFTSTLAIQLLLIETLHADQTKIGLVRSAQWLPSLMFGLLVGVLIDRMRRRTVLIAADAAAGVVTALIAVLALTGALTVGLLVAAVFAVGIAMLFSTAARQSLLPDLVPVPVLPAASARLEQTWTAAQSAGPLLGGALVRFLSAPIAVLVDAMSWVISALVLIRVRVQEHPPARVAGRSVVRELREGAGWLYRHQTLKWYAASLHLWFFFNSAVNTVLIYYATAEPRQSALAVGFALACAGITGFVAAGLSPRLGARFGVGTMCVVADWLTPLGYLLVVFAVPGPAAIWWLVAGQAVFGVGLGLKGPLETSYRNAVAPERLRGRMNGCMRTFNWGAIAVSAPLAGWAAATWGNRPAIGVAIGGLALAALLLTLSPFRAAVLPPEQLPGVTPAR